MKRHSFPGFKGRSIWDVGKFFVDSLFDADLIVRASSLAFNFFLALFPAIIFLFTVIAYIPIDNFQNDLLIQIKRLLPVNAYEVLLSTIDDILNNQHLSLLSIGFVFALYFSSNAFNSMMTTFDKYTSDKQRRAWYSARIRSIGLTLLVALIVLAMVAIITYVQVTISWLKNQHLVNDTWNYWILRVFQYSSLLILIYFVYSSLYYFGSSKVAKWHFFSVGSTLATILSLIASAGFTFYVNNFDSYNRLYGSIGTIIVLMLFIYFNCIMLLVGFELNSSVDRAEIKAIGSET
ncbi:MAG: YihY/virulence factor BrkB family protein [Bacteroidia bacterium]|nr:YihY/virulence factor BrkB family protein [Bacteroidia bacterium]